MGRRKKLDLSPPNPAPSTPDVGTSASGLFGPSPLDRLASLPVPWLLGSAVAVFLTLSIIAMWGESATFDEGIHIAAAYTALVQKDFRLVPEHPPLGRRLAAIPLLFQKVRLPEDTASWDRASHWEFAFQFLYQSGNDPDRLVLSGRLAMLFWPVLLIGSVYAWAKELYGPKGGLLALVLVAFNPTLLAHGHLVTTDTAVTSLVFLAVVTFHRWLERPGWRTSIESGVLLGGALAAKYTALLLFPMMALIGAAFGAMRLRKAASPEAPANAGGGSRERPWIRRVSDLCLIGLLGYAVLWGAYGYRFKSSLDPSFGQPASHGHVHKTTVSPRAVPEHGPLPEAYLYGLADLSEHSSKGHAAYALGRHSREGWWWYFPFAFLVKTPVLAIVLFAWGVVAAVRRATRDGPRSAALLVPVAVFLVAAMSGNLHIGIRHVLPILPFLAVAAGGVALPKTAGALEGRKERGLALLLGFTIAGSLLAAPYFLAYFNLPSLLFFHRHEMLVDSNLDWGQDLARLKRHMDRHGIPEVKLSYFGSASPRHLGLKHEMLPGHNWYSRHETEWEKASGLLPGDTVAVSATSLVGVYVHDRDYFRRVLGNLKPVAVIGHSILLYRIPEGPK